MNLELQAYAKEAHSTAPFAFVKNSSTTTASIRTVDSRKLAIDTVERVILPILELEKR